jgi:hypothetical protein
MLAEYSALRAETERRANIQWNVFALQIGSAGAIASVAISSVSNVAILLLVPFSSYMFGSRYILHDFHIKLIQRYITKSLSPRLGGGLQWGSWKAEETSTAAQRPWFGVIGWNTVHPTRLAFEGVSILTLLGSAAAITYQWLSVIQPWYIAVCASGLWIIGLLLTYFLHRSFNRASA